ncbi:MAG: nuclear transport factor 2 family protein [Oscillibacter sp.]|jgi:ketosteroid isomerase-like protein|nr:nuclear transport factor 2 family protein [Oscillibacter sp.]
MREQRETAVRLWFDMWLKKADLGILDLFAPDAVYIESWGPEYRGAEKIRHWFEEWNTRRTVLRWDILEFFHKGDQTVVRWIFRNRMNDGRREEFEGMSLVRWTQDGRIAFLQEFGCNENRYDPYRDGPEPQFREVAALWF